MAKILYIVLILILLILGIFSFLNMQKKPPVSVTLQVNLRYLPSDNPEPAYSSSYNVQTGDVIHLKDPDNKPGDGSERYSFQVVDLSSDFVTFKQVPDERGISNEVRVDMGIWKVEKKHPIAVSMGPNVPGGGPDWTLFIY